MIRPTDAILTGDGLERLCRTCKQQKPITLFHRAKNSPLGRRRICKVCACRAAKRHREIAGPRSKRQFYRHWTPEEIRQLVVMRRMGKTAVEIAEALDRTQESVEGAIRSFGLQKQPHNRGVHTRTILAEVKKHGPEKAAKVLGLHRSTVYNRLQGCKSYKPHPSRSKR